MDNIDIKEIVKPLPDEKPYHYEAFLGFASLHYSDRTLENTAKNTGYAYQTIKTWCGLFKWAERIMQVDAFRWAKEFEQRQELVKEDNKRFILANREIKQKAMEASKNMLSLANKLINAALVSDEVIENDYVTTKDGAVVPTTTVIKMKSKVSDIPRLVEATVKVARLVNDLPMDDSIKRPAFDANLDELSAEELIALRDENMATIQYLEANNKIS